MAMRAWSVSPFEGLLAKQAEVEVLKNLKG
jgi:hypothetical protein